MAKRAQHPGGAAAAVEAIVRPVVEGMGLRLWDVRFEKEGPDWFLRVLIDRDTPLDTDTCEAVSRAIDPLLDEADPIDQSYYLEVGSPGLGRKLTRPEHFAALAGQKCAARLTNRAAVNWKVPSSGYRTAKSPSKQPKALSVSRLKRPVSSNFAMTKTCFDFT